VGEHTVNQGDCMLSIAEEYGVNWKKLWDHPQNAELKKLRKNPNLLLPGDVVHIPERESRYESKSTNQRHKFVKKTARAKVRLRLVDVKGQPRRSLRYSANVDGSLINGSTDGDGYITLPAPPTAREVKLSVVDSGRTEEYTLPLGHIDPIESLTGVQQRLANLGYFCRSELGTLGDATQAALRAFQKKSNLSQTGEIDEGTRQLLKQAHGC
jgi:putative peptidoglycan binding protein